MKLQTQTDQIIADLLKAPAARAMDRRQQHLYKQALLSLVRLAKSEQMLAMKQDLRKAVGPTVATYLERPKKLTRPVGTSQQQLELK